MMERTIISWSLMNMLTIFLMAAGGYGIAAFVRWLWVTYGPGAAQSAVSTGTY